MRLLLVIFVFSFALPSPAAEIVFGVRVEPLRTPGISSERAAQIVWEALREWDDHCGAGFKPSSAPWMSVTFRTGPTETGMAAEHKGVATLQGVVTFSDRVRWTERHLKWCALHEIGHFLGRNCPSNGEEPPSDSVMGRRPMVRLGATDIERARQVFGEPE